MCTPAIQIGVPMPQIQSQHVTPLIVGQPKVIPYPMWYNTLPPFIPMDLNRYFIYHSGIKGPDPLIFGKREKYVVGITQAKRVPPIEQLEETQYPIKIPISRLEQPTLISRGVPIQQTMAITLLVNVANGLPVHGNDVSFQQPRRVHLHP